MPTEMAANWSVSGLAARSPATTSRSSASCSATKPPQMEAVRVPPSAWMTSQSTVTSRSPSAPRSQTARRDRPMRRWISWLRPETRRRIRSPLEPGSIEYSAVTQPLPVPFSQRGTPSPIEAVHSTRVRPNATRHEPSAASVKSRSNVKVRSSSFRRPSGRIRFVPRGGWGLFGCLRPRSRRSRPRWRRLRRGRRSRRPWKGTSIRRRWRRTRWWPARRRQGVRPP